MSNATVERLPQCCGRPMTCLEVEVGKDTAKVRYVCTVCNVAANRAEPAAPYHQAEAELRHREMELRTSRRKN